MMPGLPQHPRFEVDIAAGGMILIKQIDGVSDDRPVIDIHPKSTGADRASLGGRLCSTEPRRI